MFNTSEHCERIHLFVDGELPSAEEAAVQDHLLECRACERELETALLLRGRIRDLPGTRVAVSPQRRRWPRRAAAVASAAAVIALAVAVMVRPGRQPRPELAGAFDLLATDQRRPLVERLTYQPAARHRTAPAVMRASRPAAAVPIDALAATRDSGDAHGELALWLWAGDLDEASAVAERLAGDPGCANDLAVLAIRRSRLDQARALLDGVLTREPTAAAALWNRALLFERLGDRASAIRDFEAVASLQEPGWAAEARQRAARLRDDGQRGP
jgi:hypothetical protein